MPAGEQARALRRGNSGYHWGDNASLRLDLDNQLQPDVYLMIDPACGGQARIDEDGYVAGAPELIAEVAATSASDDPHGERHVYRRSGVREYLVWRVQDRAMDWFALREGRCSPPRPGRMASSTASSSPASGWPPQRS